MADASWAFAAIVLAISLCEATAGSVWLYSNLNVISGQMRVDALKDNIKYLVPAIPLPSPTQPINLFVSQGYVITGNKASYYEVEGLATSPQKIAALADYVRRGASLVLADGATAGNSNNFLPLLSSLLGYDPLCQASNVTVELTLRKRYSEGYFAPLDDRVKARAGEGYSSMDCKTGVVVYSAYVDKTEWAGMIMWELGSGAIFWIGSSYFKPHVSGYEDMMTAALRSGSLHPAPPAPPRPPPPPPKPQTPRRAPRPTSFPLSIPSTLQGSPPSPSPSSPPPLPSTTAPLPPATEPPAYPSAPAPPPPQPSSPPSHPSLPSPPPPSPLSPSPSPPSPNPTTPPPPQLPPPSSPPPTPRPPIFPAPPSPSPVPAPSPPPSPAPSPTSRVRRPSPPPVVEKASPPIEEPPPDYGPPFEPASPPPPSPSPKRAFKGR